MFLRARNPATIPPTSPLNAGQVRNNAGGFVYKVNDWDRLDQFLITGTQGGTFYVGQDKLTAECTDLVLGLLKEDGARVINRVVKISHEGRAAKQDYGLYALALATTVGLKTLDPNIFDKIEYRITRKLAYRAIPKVCRTASTLMQFISYLKHRKGWSRGLRNAVAEWYNQKPLDKLSYQVVKYPSRHNTNHRKILKCAHPNPDLGVPGAQGHELERKALYQYMVGKEYNRENIPEIIRNKDEVHRLASEKKISVALVSGLPREALPNEWLKDTMVWNELLVAGMPYTALLRNLATMTRVGLFKLDHAVNTACSILTDAENIRRSRVHPMSILLALKQYGTGKSGSKNGVAYNENTYAPVGRILDALNVAFNLSFKYCEPIGKELLIAVDCSGSMTSYKIQENLMTAWECALAMSLCHLPDQPDFVMFDTSCHEMKLDSGDTLERVMGRVRANGGGTNCALPMQYAMQAWASYEKSYDAIVMYTDNETWAGNSHASEALKELRQRAAKTKLVVCSTTATGYSTGDTHDPLTLNICGFDAAVPRIVAGFVGGEGTARLEDETEE